MKSGTGLSPDVRIRTTANNPIRQRLRGAMLYQIAMPVSAMTYDCGSALWLKITQETSTDARRRTRISVDRVQIDGLKHRGSKSTIVPASCVGHAAQSRPSQSCTIAITLSP